MSENSFTFTEPVINALKTRSDVTFVATASATINTDNKLNIPEQAEVVLQIGNKKYTKEEAAKITVDGDKLMVDGKDITLQGGGDATVRCEKCVRKTRSRRQKRGGRRVRHNKTTKK